MTLFIGGVHRRRHPVVAVEGECPACRRVSIHLGIVAKRALHMFWIPILPLGSGKQFVCLLCGKEQKVRKLTWTNETALPTSAVRSRLADLNSYYASLLQPDGAPASPADVPAPITREPEEEWDEPWDEDSTTEDEEEDG